jgi:hypothetical protein
MNPAGGSRTVKSIHEKLLRWQQDAKAAAASDITTIVHRYCHSM